VRDAKLIVVEAKTEAHDHLVAIDLAAFAKRAAQFGDMEPLQVADGARRARHRRPDGVFEIIGDVLLGFEVAGSVKGPLFQDQGALHAAA